MKIINSSTISKDDQKKLEKDKKPKKEKKLKKDKVKKKAKKRKHHDEPGEMQTDVSFDETKRPKVDTKIRSEPFSFPIKYILAPMVGASELAFRMLCRKYGAQLCYTPMMSSSRFTDPKYRQEEFQTIPEDRPLVCHFSANDPKEFTEAGKLVEHCCDAVDLNLGCPQRTAYLGHFGSYLLDPKDRNLICDIVRMASKSLSIPIFVKIRLLDTIQETIELCHQLKDAGASLICIHARYRASFERKGPGARDGPALLDQILEVRNALGPSFPIIANGNVITFDDVQRNLEFTKSDGVMSAEGILDDPCLFLPRFALENKSEIQYTEPSSLTGTLSKSDRGNDKTHNLIRKFKKKLRKIEILEKKAYTEALSHDQKQKVLSKVEIQKQLSDAVEQQNASSILNPIQITKTIPISELQRASRDKPAIAHEYIELAQKYPTQLRTVIFHTRRILKQELNKYQLMEDCINSKSIEDIKAIINKISKYIDDPSSFKFDKQKAVIEKEALERKKREEGKRKEFEARMIRKAKREGLQDREFYLRQGTSIPNAVEIQSLKRLSRDDQLKKWRENNHSQHCMAYHLEPSGCKRDRACAFLHVDAIGTYNFDEKDEVAG